MSFDSIIHVVAGYIYPALLMLFFFGLTIFIHELGHFLAARRRGMKVERFSLGFGPKIFGWNRDGVEYQVAWIPFGGYVALPQMAPMEALEGKTETKPEELPPASPASKIIVSLAGPAMNMVLAVLLAIGVWYFGLPVPVNPSVVGWIEPGSHEEQLGIQAGDRIVQINDRDIGTWMDVQRAVALCLEPSVRVVTERNGQRTEHLLETEINEAFGLKTIKLYPEGRPYANRLRPGWPAEAGGVKPGDEFMAVDNVPISTRKELIEFISKKPGVEPVVLKVMRGRTVLQLTVVPRLDPNGNVRRIGVELDDKLQYAIERPGPQPVALFREIFGLMGDTVYALVHHKQTGVGARSLSGPVGIAGGLWQEIAHGGIRRGLWFAVLLNINLGILNLLPLPVLDGGHIVFATIEAAIRRPLNARLVHALSVTFASVLIAFMLYVTFFDIQRLAFGRFQLRNAPTQTAEPVGSTETNRP